MAATFQQAESFGIASRRAWTLRIEALFDDVYADRAVPLATVNCKNSGPKPATKRTTQHILPFDGPAGEPPVRC